MKKGFTVVELLAVIVILAAISLITYSVMSGNIESTKKKSFETSAQNTLAAAKEYVIANFEENDFPEGGIDITNQDMDIKNNKFISGMIIRNSDDVIEVMNLTDGNYCANGSKNNMEITKGSCEASDTTAPIVSVKVLKTKINSAQILVKMQDAQSGLVEYSYCYGIEEMKCKTNTLNNERSVVKEVINLKELEQNKKYKIKVTVKNNSKKEDIEESSVEKEFETLEVSAPEFSVSASTYTSSKIVTIKYPELTGYVYKYYVNGEEKETKENKVKIEVKDNTLVKASIFKNELEVISDEVNISGIDNVEPTANITIEKENEWTLSKLVKIESKDEGTGLALRAYSYDGGVKWVKESERTYTANQIIKVRTRDKLGNINPKFKINGLEYDNYPIKNIDNVGPRINLEVTEGSKNSDDNEWYINNKVGVTLTIVDQAKVFENNEEKLIDTGIGIDESTINIKINNQTTEYTKLSNGKYLIYVTTNGTNTITVGANDLLGNTNNASLTFKKDDVVPTLSSNGGNYTGTLESKKSFSYNVGVSGIKSYTCNPESITWKSSNITCTLTTNSGYTVSKTAYFRFYYGATANYRSESYECGHEEHGTCRSCRTDSYYWGPVEVCSNYDCDFRWVSQTCYRSVFSGYSCSSGGTLSGSNCYF